MLKEFIRPIRAKGLLHVIWKFHGRAVKSRARMKTVYILRHAKSSWDDHSLSDFERPLNGRGLRAAQFIGSLMKQHGYTPDAIVSSPAERTKQTAELVREAAGFEPEITFNELIYEATVGTLVLIIAGINETISSVLIVGHNPGAEGLVYYLTGEIAPMPTAALAVIDFDIDNWADIGDGRGNLRRVFRPREEMS